MGESSGHPFRGNQWQAGQGGGSSDLQARADKEAGPVVQRHDYKRGGGIIKKDGQLDHEALSAKIREAVAENIDRLAHGVDKRGTGYTAFVIDEAGKVHQYDQAEKTGGWGLKSIVVHSHSSSHKSLQPVETFSADDVAIFSRQFGKGAAYADVVIGAGGKMDILHVTPDTPRAGMTGFKNAEARKMLHPKYAEAEKFMESPEWKAAVAKGGGHHAHVTDFITRERIGKFAKANKMVYIQGVRWKK